MGGLFVSMQHLLSNTVMSLCIIMTSPSMIMDLYFTMSSELVCYLKKDSGGEKGQLGKSH